MAFAAGIPHQERPLKSSGTIINRAWKRGAPNENVITNFFLNNVKRVRKIWKSICGVKKKKVDPGDVPPRKQVGPHTCKATSIKWNIECDLNHAHISLRNTQVTHYPLSDYQSDYTDRSPSWQKLTRHSDAREIPCLVPELEGSWRYEHDLSLLIRLDVPDESSSHPRISFLYKPLLILPSHISLGLLNSFFIQDSPIKTRSSMCHSCPAHYMPRQSNRLRFHSLSNQVGEEYKLWNSSLLDFRHSSIIQLFLCPQISELQTPSV